MQPEPSPDTAKRKVWDVPTRLFHWALVGTVLTGLYLGEYRSFTTIQLHFYFGYATGGLIAFRLLWGVIGPRPVRLSGLFPSPRALWAYGRNLFVRRPSGVAGHNPVGALSVLAIYSSRVVMGLIVLHLAAILFYRLWKRENLVTAMITGWKTVRRDDDNHQA